MKKQIKEISIKKLKTASVNFSEFFGIDEETKLEAMVEIIKDSIILNLNILNNGFIVCHNVAGERERTQLLRSLNMSAIVHNGETYAYDPDLIIERIKVELEDK